MQALAIVTVSQISAECHENMFSLAEREVYCHFPATIVILVGAGILKRISLRIGQAIDANNFMFGAGNFSSDWILIVCL